MNPEELLQWLRRQIKSIDEITQSLCNSKLKDLSSDDLEAEKYWRGEIQGYESTIKVIRGLSEREFQLEKKRGTL